MKSTRLLLPETRNLSYSLTRRAAYSTSTGTSRSDRASISRRSIHHSSPSKDAAIPVVHTSTTESPESSSSTPTAAIAPLSNLPLSQILRTYLITSISSSPTALGASTKILQSMLESRNPLFQIDKNPLMRALLWETFYKQFCAGENATQVSQECANLRQQGYAGVILEYALEVLKDAESDELEDIATWRQGMLDTVSMATPGDFVALKWSGMGPAAMRRMKDSLPPSSAMSTAMHAVCDLAASKNIALLPAAEETWSLDGFHKWCLDLQREYNTKGKSVVYSTYQAYLKQTPSTLSDHLSLAKAENFTLGIKLVRGAYLGTEVRSLIHPSIEATHSAYDGIMSSVLHRKFNPTLSPSQPGQSFPEEVNFVIASHNAVSVELAQKLRGEQFERGEELTPTVFAQLQGMADEVSCALLAGNRVRESEGRGVQERVLKYTTWGTMFQCLNYLIRRAAENKDAAGRTGESRRAMGREIRRRMGIGR